MRWFDGRVGNDFAIYAYQMLTQLVINAPSGRILVLDRQL